MKRVKLLAIVTLGAVPALPVVLALTGCNQIYGLQETALKPGKNSLVCECSCDDLPIVPPAVSSISVSADDAQYVVGDNNTDLRGATLEFGFSQRGSTVVGLRFPYLAIPAGAHIRQAYIDFTAAPPLLLSASTTLHIFAEASGDAPPFAGSVGLTDRQTLATPVDWAITEPWTVGQPYRTPSLAPLLQELVDRADWKPLQSPGAATAVVFLVRGDQAGRAARSFDSGSGAPRLTVEWSTRLFENKPIPVCMTSADNPNLDGPDDQSDPTRFQDDCAGRVGPTLDGLATACGLVTDLCTCTYQANSLAFADKCDVDCTEETLGFGCSNLGPVDSSVVKATNAPGDQPVCTPHSPLGELVFARRAECAVDGLAALLTSDETKFTRARGTVEFVGDPCPGQSCAVGLAHRLRLDDITFSSLFGSATFSELVALGGSVPAAAAALDATGDGQFAVGSTSSTGRGKRDNGDVMGLVASNAAPIHVLVDWAGAACRMDGALIGAVDPESSFCEGAGPYASQLCYPEVPAVCGSDPACTGDPDPDHAGASFCRCVQVASSTDATVSLDVHGTLRNQPPTSRAGPDQVVECNLTNRASFSLDGTESHDPDANVTSLTWLRGGRAGEPVGHQPKIALEQAVGTQVPYVFRLIDGFAQAAEDTVQVSVVDTTPPIVACNAQPTMLTSEIPISFRATASDVCDPSVASLITGYTCFKVSKNKVVEKVTSCKVTLAGDQITIVDSGGIDDHVQWTVRAVDDAGNAATATCEVLVVAKK